MSIRQQRDTWVTHVIANVMVICVGAVNIDVQRYRQLIEISLNTKIMAALAKMISHNLKLLVHDSLQEEPSFFLKPVPLLPLKLLNAGLLVLFRLVRCHCGIEFVQAGHFHYPVG